MLKALLATLEILISIGKVLELIFRRILLRPLIMAARLVFYQLLVPLYRFYLVTKKTLSSIFAPAKNRIIYPLLNKSTVHVVIAVIVVAVIANNIFVRETRAQEFGQQMLLTSIIGNTQEADITEVAAQGTTTITDTQKNGHAASVHALAAADPSSSAAADTGEIVTTENSAAVVKPSLTQTTVGERPRDDVIHYSVEGGDTVSTIAEKFGISTNTILWENKLGPRDYIKPGDSLTILPFTGVSHQVQSGDTVDKIAKKYSVTTDAIIESNKLASAEDIDRNEILLIPDGVQPEEPKPVVRVAQSQEKSSIFNIPAPSRASSGARLLWPTISHKINQYYKWRHTGLDIDGDYSTPVYAADDGRVEYAASNRSGYGLHVIINHGSGVKTLYGHESKLFVKVGDSVKRGQSIGIVGCTGRCTGTHLHFEVMINGGKQNPLSYL